MSEAKMTRSMSAELRGDLKAREAHGMKKYGVTLEPWNGRNPIEDAYEEAMDAIVYLKQAKVERQLTVERLRWQAETLRNHAAKCRDSKVMHMDTLLADRIGRWMNDFAAPMDLCAARCEDWANDLEADIPRKRGKKTKKREQAPFLVPGIAVNPMAQEAREEFKRRRWEIIDLDPILEEKLKEADKPMTDEEMATAVVRAQDFRSQELASRAAAEAWEQAIARSARVKEINSSMGEFKSPESQQALDAARRWGRAFESLKHIDNPRAANYEVRATSRKEFCKSTQVAGCSCVSHCAFPDFPELLG